MATVRGFVERIKFRNEENGYTVLSLADGKDETILVGTFHYISEGEMVEATGTMIEHPVYGEQLQVESYEIKTPEDNAAIERYLGSGAIKGVGAALAARIVKKFKADTFRIMEEEPERLSEVKGISEKMAMAIGEQVEAKKEMRQAMMFLQDYGISMNLAVKIYQEYGHRTYSVLKENPYRLADDIPGVGFKMADEIAQKTGLFTDSDYRIKSGIFYTLLQAVGNGHTYLPESELKANAAELLQIHPEDMDKHLMDLQMEKKIIVKGQQEGERIIYSSQHYYLELNTAKMLCDLNIKGDIPSKTIEKRLEQIQESEQIELDEMQQQAVLEAVNNGLMIITGGPGTGKTTTINAIIQYFEMEGMEILLAAPTGRAAKRMTEATGYEARTIHRMLELTGMPDEKERSGMHFERNEENPLDADVIIIDEMSMVDISLMHSLLKAVTVGTRLILVGDVNQLPSVGAGSVLKDIILSGQFAVVELTKIFRQASQSDIVVNAHKINKGIPVTLDNKSMDFFFLKRYDANVIIRVLIALIQNKLPKFVNATPYEIQVLTPMRKGLLGVERLNMVLQQYLNPPDNQKREKEHRQGLFREGDKVMQIKNNYQTEWEIRGIGGIRIEKGVGVFNGDMGFIESIDEENRTVTVVFDDERRIVYDNVYVEELELAYAITIHKSQGSEFKVVITPAFMGSAFLMNRNILYTGITRAKELVVVVGNQKALKYMVDNTNSMERYSSLKERILDIVSDDKIKEE